MTEDEFRILKGLLHTSISLRTGWDVVLAVENAVDCKGLTVFAVTGIAVTVGIEFVIVWHGINGTFAGTVLGLITWANVGTEF